MISTPSGLREFGDDFGRQPLHLRQVVEEEIEHDRPGASVGDLA